MYGNRRGYLLEAVSENNQEINYGKRIKVWAVIILFILLAVAIKKLAGQNISSVADFKEYLSNFGIVGPVVLTAFQAFQVVVPILPGYLGCAAGAMAFGTMTGFWCNYIGISAGSIAAYFIARKYGMDVVLTMFSEKQYRKWSERIKKKKSYAAFLFVATLLPLFPDDFLCYFSGLIKMDARKFIWIIILGKPWCILVYSVAFGLIN